MECYVINRSVSEIEKVNDEPVLRTYALALNEDGLPVTLGSIWSVDLETRTGCFGETALDGDTYLAEYDLSDFHDWNEFHNAFFTAWAAMPKIMKNASNTDVYKQITQSLMWCYPCMKEQEEESVPFSRKKITPEQFFQEVMKDFMDV